MKRSTLMLYGLIISIILSKNNSIYSDCVPAGVSFFDLQSLCLQPNSCCVSGNFTTTGGQPKVPVNSQFCVQRLDNGLYSITLKKAFCCPISAVAIAEIMTPGCIPVTPGQNYNAGDFPAGLAISPDRTCLAVSNFDSNNISVFSINSDCTLTLRQPTHNVGLNPFGLAYSSSCLVVANSGDSPDGTISVFSRNGSNCGLSEIPTSPVTVGQKPSSVSFSPSTDGATCLAVADFNSNAVLLFTVDNNSCTPSFLEFGIFNFFVFGQQLLSFLSTTCLAILVKNGIEIFQISGCTAQPPTPVSAFPLNNPTAVAFSPTTGCLAVTNVNTTTFQNLVNIFTVNDTTCAPLTLIGSTQLDNGLPFVPLALDFSPDGTCLVVASSLIAPGIETSVITTFSVDGNTCQITPIKNLALANSRALGVKFLSNNCFVVTNSSTNNPKTITVFNVAGVPIRVPVNIIEAMTPGCFILKLDLQPGQSDAGITVNFFATQCT